jgi:hypothetical protein
MYPWVLANYLPMIVLLIFLARGHAVKMVTAFAAFFKTRWHFAISVILFLAVTHGWQAFEAYRFLRIPDRGYLLGHWFDGFWLNPFITMSFPLMLLAAAIGLLPAQKQPRPTVKTA